MSTRALTLGQGFISFQPQHLVGTIVYDVLFTTKLTCGLVFTSLSFHVSCLVLGNPELQVRFCQIACVMRRATGQLEFCLEVLECEFTSPRDARNKEPGILFVTRVLNVH